MKLCSWEEFWQPFEGREVKSLKRLQGADWHRASKGKGAITVLERLSVSNKGNYCGIYSIIKEGSDISRPRLCYHWLTDREVALIKKDLETT